MWHINALKLACRKVEFQTFSVVIPGTPASGGGEGKKGNEKGGELDPHF